MLNPNKSCENLEQLPFCQKNTPTLFEKLEASILKMTPFID